MKASPVYRTRTGAFPIGFRRMGQWAWHRDAAELAAWTAGEGFAFLDLGPEPVSDVAAVRSAGMGVGTVDLLEWGDFPRMLSADPERRAEAVGRAAARIRAAAGLGVRAFFTLMLAENGALPARETFGFMLESYRQLSPVLAEAGARIAIEGWPEHRAHCCNPGSCRLFLREIGSPAFGINYDPSHLIRLGIDPVRFLREFAPHVVHVHGKDTEIAPENLYEGGEPQRQARLDDEPWRYAIPGHGEARWPAIFRILRDAGYAGGVSIEHEDAAFIGSPDVEKEGLLHAARFLTSC